MKEFEKIKKGFREDIEKSINNNYDILLESFIEYYGEEYRDVITKHYKNISYVFYIPIVFLEEINEENNSNRYESIIKAYNKFQKMEKLKNKFKIFGSNNFHILPANVVGTINLTEKELYEIDYKYTNKENPMAHFSYDIFDEKLIINSTIFFPIPPNRDTAFIHEINHCITNNPMLVVSNEIHGPKVVGKTGIATETKIERNVEELLNDKAAEEITQIFRKKGGDISAFCFDDISKYAYEINYYLIDEFYDTFKDYIKMARITEKKNILIERIGKENYQNFCNLINAYVFEYKNVEIPNKDEKINNISLLVHKMKENASNQKDMTNEDLQDYYKQLEDNDYNVRILNELDTTYYSDKKGKTR